MKRIFALLLCLALFASCEATQFARVIGDGSLCHRGRFSVTRQLT